MAVTLSPGLRFQAARALIEKPVKQQPEGQPANGQETAAIIENNFETESAGEITLPGGQERVHMYRLVSESDAAAAKSEADQEVCGAWWVQEHARGASRSMGAQQRLTPPLLQCAKCKAAAYCSKECQVPPPPNTHMQRAAPEPAPARTDPLLRACPAPLPVTRPRRGRPGTSASARRGRAPRRPR